MPAQTAFSTAVRKSPTTSAVAPHPESSVPDVDSVETWVGDDLPLVASPVAVLDDVAVYFTTVGTDQFVTVVDLVERRELWRRLSHQQGRISGVVYSPHVDVATERVVVTTYDDQTRAAEMAAFDLRTGDEQWRRPVDWAQSRPSRFVDDTLLCFDTVDGLTTELDPDGGPFEVTVDGGLERTIGGGDLRLSADPRGGRIEMGAIVRAGYERAGSGPSPTSSLRPWRGGTDPTAGVEPTSTTTPERRCSWSERSTPTTSTSGQSSA